MPVSGHFCKVTLSFPHLRSSWHRGSLEVFVLTLIKIRLPACVAWVYIYVCPRMCMWKPELNIFSVFSRDKVSHWPGSLLFFQSWGYSTCSHVWLLHVGDFNSIPQTCLCPRWPTWGRLTSQLPGILSYLPLISSWEHSYCGPYYLGLVFTVSSFSWGKFFTHPHLSPAFIPVW